MTDLDLWGEGCVCPYLAQDENVRNGVETTQCRASKKTELSARCVVIDGGEIDSFVSDRLLGCI